MACIKAMDDLGKYYGYRLVHLIAKENNKP